MPRVGLLVLLLVVTAGTLLWFARTDAPLPTGEIGNGSTPAAAASPAAAAPARDGAAAMPRSDATPAPRDEATRAATGPQLRVRLRGLHPEAPWTATLHLDVAYEGRGDPRRDHRVAAQPDTNGVATLLLPDWYRVAAEQHGHLVADDPHYQRLEHRWQRAPDPTQELVVDVQVVGVLTGRVVDAGGAPVAAARVAAFQLVEGRPRDGPFATTNSAEDGTWRLATPPGAPLWVLAVPMQRAGGRKLEGAPHGGIRDTGVLATTRLPAATAATPRAGTTTMVPDLQLPAAVAITGVVQWSDGEAIDGAEVEALPNDAAALAFAKDLFVYRLADGRLAPRAKAMATVDGAFTLPGVAGGSLDVRIVALGHVDAELVGGGQSQRIVAPATVGFRVPRPVLLRCRHNGAPVAGAHVEITDPLQVDRPETRRTNARGELSLVTFAPLRVRASHERLRSAARDLRPDDAGTTIDLDLAATRTPVTIGFDGEFRVRSTVVDWRRDDGLAAREQFVRDDRDGGFTLFLEPGRYELTAGPGDGERNDALLLPVTRTVEVGSEAITLRLPATFGGTFTVMVTDSSGAWVGGRCELRDPGGNDVTEHFLLADSGRRGAIGELLAGGTNAFGGVLAPGVYELMGDFGAHGAHRERITIRARETTEVRIRLP